MSSILEAAEKGGDGGDVPGLLCGLMALKQLP